MSGLLACVSTDPGDAINRHIRNPFDSSVVMPVYFATNRVPLSLNPSCSDAYFGVRNGHELAFGACEINVPRKHAIGELDAHASRYADPNIYFKFGQYTAFPPSEFARKIADHGGDELMVFVHGFNVKFEEALLRAAQISYDTKFQGSTVVFTWPAGAQAGVLSQVLIHQTYAENQANARNTIEYFVRLMRELRRTGKTVHVLVHSMGHQIVLPALASLADDGRFVRELVLNAPDFPNDELQRLAPRLTQVSWRVTLYCSPGDKALLASGQINANHRAGLCARIPGIDVINVNELDNSALGHGYYSGRMVLTDVYQVLLGVDARRRLFIRASDPGGGEDFILRR